MNAPAISKDAIPEITKEQASEYDHIILIDKSGSMANPSLRLKGKSRWQEVEEYVTGFANFVCECDEDGITLVTFNGDIKVFDGIRNASAVADVFKQQSPGGTTNLHLALDAAFHKLKSSGKPGFIHVFTDGEPNDKDAVKKSIGTAVKAMKEDKDLGLSFMQVGDDEGATRFLQYLDDDLKADLKLPFDAVNAMTVSQMDGLNPGQILYQALND